MLILSLQPKFFLNRRKRRLSIKGYQTELLELIITDLAKTDPKILRVTFDGEDIVGSFIIRKKFLRDQRH